MKRLRLGQAVKVADPMNLAARFYSPEHQGITGAGGIKIDRQLLDGPAFVVSIVARTNSTRGLIAFGSPESNQGMWLDAGVLEPRRQ